MCNCVKKIADSINEMYETDNAVFDIYYYPRDGEHAYPFEFKIKGKKRKIKIRGGYCPFCGEKIEVK